MAGVVERFNRTLKTTMWKYFYSKGTYKWIDVLDQLVYNCNNTKHSTILIKPKGVNKNNEDEVGQHYMVIYMETYLYLSLKLAIQSGYPSIKAFSQKVMKSILQKNCLKSLWSFVVIQLLMK